MTLPMIILFISIVPILVYLNVNLYKLINLDAKSRGIEKPTLWSFIGISGSRGEGLILYLLKRSDYRKNMSDADIVLSEKYKAKVITSFIIIMIVSIALVFLLIKPSL